MDNMIITSAQYWEDPMFNEVVSIRATIDGIQMSVPIDPSNRHYAEIMRQVEAGTLTIEEAE